MTEVAPAASAEAGSVANAPAPAPSHAPSADADWRASLPEDLRANPGLANYSSLESQVRTHLNLEKMLGSEKVPIPKEGDEEGAQRFFKAAGWPDKPDGYGFKQPEKLPDGMVYNAELDGKLAGIFHGSKLTASQASKVREGLMEIVSSGATETLEASKLREAETAAAIQKAEETLKAEWGQAYEQRGKVAGAAINKFLSPETIAAMEAAGLANNPAIVKDMYKLGTALAGEKELIGEAEQNMAPADYEAAIADFRQKHNAALFDRSHPDHALRTAEYTKLFERRYPSQAA